MDVSAYLDHIDYRGSRVCTAETLRQLQLAHLRAIPFENLSIHWGEPIELDDEALFDKIIRGRRGGFCYELNGLFAALLRALGFEVEKVAAEVMGANGHFGRDFSHMALVATLDERWLVDVGFGDSFLQPLRLEDRRHQPQGERSFRVDVDPETPDGQRLRLMQREGDDGWHALYRFRLEPYEYPDFSEMCHYHQTSAESHFTQRRVCSLATCGGRVTLSEMRLITTEGLERRERELASAEEFAQILLDVFGVEQWPEP